MGDRGMTLIEVLVAVALIAVCAVPMLQLFYASTVTTHHGGYISTATAVASATIEQLRSGSLELKSATLDPLPNHPGYSRQVEISSYSVDPVRLRQVKVTVNWQQGSQPQSIQVTTVLQVKQ